MIKPAEKDRRRTASSVKVTQNLREQIEAGHYRPGEPLPAERVLAASFGANRRTIRAAVEHLASEGLLSIKPRCRPVVSSGQHPVRARTRTSTVRPLVNSQFVALVMWHGIVDRGATAQQLIFWGMNRGLANAGYHGVFLDLGDIGSEQENAEREAACLQYALDHEFQGIVFYAYAYRQNRELIREVARRMPMVLIDRMIAGVDVDFVGIDNRLSMYNATRHLIDLGHKRIAYITHNEPINTIIERQEGYSDAMREEFGADAQEIVMTAPMSEKSEWPMFDALVNLKATQRPTAILCVNDWEANEVARRLALLGISVPDNISIVGFDNIISSLPNGIGLTTVAQPFEEIGKTAAATLLNRFASPDAPSVYIELPTDVVVRQSAKRVF